MRYFSKLLLLVSVVLLCLGLNACTTPRPDNVSDICRIFKQYPSWYNAAHKAQQRWGIPIATQLAVIYQESNFHQRIQPPREYIFGIIPWFRPSSSYGYTQAQDAVWSEYKKATGNRFAARSNFSDSVDFIAWYLNSAHHTLGIPRNATFQLYLAYHEGFGGYRRRTYLHKHWLVKVAHRVSARAISYARQLPHCEAEFRSRWWF